ncbi:MAG: hypothetical protein A2Z71_05905 [Chloroflexi bacterium RBG_13_50_21]|nr:MAG: hypothetical protein A2Z71_05905 [Chloroflexi bacterium RBG_13_50_21]
MIKEVEFPSEGAMLRGLLFLPESQTKRPPLVIMAHGTTGTVTMVVDKYAEGFPSLAWQSCSTTTGTLEGARANHGRRSIPGFSAGVTVMR